MARLHFPPSSQRTGFISDSLSRRAGDEYEVIRELVQNSLDAAREARRPSSVVFTIKEVSINSIPSIAEYRTAFDAAKARRQGLQTTLGASPSNHEVNVIQRIDDLLARERIPILLLRDNGIGLNQSTLQRVLSEGDTSKTNTSAGGLGSWGVGHMAAFGASALRYVLYAGRSLAQDPQRGFEDTATGEAILAAHEQDGQIRSPNGYWVEELEQSSLSRSHTFVEQVPALIAAELDALEDTGSVVCMTGFNWFSDDGQKAAEKIARVVALNFVVAIHGQQLAITIRDQVHDRSLNLDRGTLGEVLAATKEERRARSAGQIAGGRAYAAHETLLQVQPEQIEGGVLYVRPAKLGRGASSHVNVFRDGMWITNKAPRLGSSDFGGTAPFDAVLAIERSDVPATSGLYEQVRDAEGAEHRDLKKAELSPDAWKEMVQRLQEIGDRIRSTIGEQIGEEQVVEGFAQIEGAQMRDATVLPPLRPRHREGEVEVVVPTTDHTKDPPNPNPNPRPPSDPDRVRRARAIPVRAAIAPHGAADDDAVNAIKVYWAVSEDAGTVGVRLRVDSGSDSTCEVPFSPAWLKLKRLSALDGTVLWSGDATEVSLDSSIDAFIINLVEPLTNLTGVELDVVVSRKRGSS